MMDKKINFGFIKRHRNIYVDLPDNIIKLVIWHYYKNSMTYEGILKILDENFGISMVKSTLIRKLAEIKDKPFSYVPTSIEVEIIQRLIDPFQDYERLDIPSNFIKIRHITDQLRHKLYTDMTLEAKEIDSIARAIERLTNLEKKHNLDSQMDGIEKRKDDKGKSDNKMTMDLIPASLKKLAIDVVNEDDNKLNKEEDK